MNVPKSHDDDTVLDDFPYIAPHEGGDGGEEECIRDTYLTKRRCERGNVKGGEMRRGEMLGERGGEV